MPYVPGFRYDIFVSYASEDNVDGWVEKFQAHLTGELARLIGRPFSEKTVFFDKLRLEVGGSYPDVLDAGSRDSAVLVALLSPNYLNSNWCSRERDAFQRQLVRNATYEESLAACRVRPTGSLPQRLDHAQQADFVMPNYQEPWPAGSAKWIEAVNRLAVQIKHMLQKLRSRAGAVFVGKAMNSHMLLRDDLVDYLAQQHFRATPESVALLDDREASQEALTEAVCAVHFIGQSSQEALACLEDSTEICKGPTVTFQPFGVQLSGEEDFLLLQLAPEHYPHRLGPNETELKKFLEELLTRRTESPMTAASLGIICDSADIAWAQKFQAAELSVEYPRFLQDNLSNSEQIQRWRQLLKSCHGLLFYHGRSNEKLLRALEKLADQEKTAALRRWYLADPDIETKRQRRAADPIFPEGLEEFLNRVRSKVKIADALAGGTPGLGS